MNFNLPIFVLFSAVVIFFYYIISPGFRKYYLLGASVIFYGMQDIFALPLLIILISMSYFTSLQMRRETEHNKRKRWMIFGIGIVVMTLIVCKNIVFKMPLGISYYSFKIISYLADVYSEKREYEHRCVNYAVYVLFFPQILCGPISRSSEFIEQLDFLIFDKEKCGKGICLILSGLFKKMVIAERLAVYVDTIFENFQSYSGIALWMAAFFYSIQLYLDFAGYSEIVIGITYLLGIKTQSNFVRPYFASSIQEFWDRWHISLSSWLRDYIYIPLGGNRKGNTRKKINILVTFCLSGFWHGNGSGYLVWGIYHGILNLFPKRKTNSVFQQIYGQVVTFTLVMFGWIFFRLEDAHEAMKYIISMFVNLKVNLQIIVDAILPFSGDYSCIALFLTVIIFILFEWIIEIRDEKQKEINFMRIIFYVFSIVLFGNMGSSSFIYMNY